MPKIRIGVLAEFADHIPKCIADFNKGKEKYGDQFVWSALELTPGTTPEGKPCIQAEGEYVDDEPKALEITCYVRKCLKHFKENGDFMAPICQVEGCRKIFNSLSECHHHAKTGCPRDGVSLNVEDCHRVWVGGIKKGEFVSFYVVHLNKTISQ